MGEGKILPGSIQLQTQFVMIPYGHIAIINAKKNLSQFFFLSQNFKWQYTLRLWNSGETEKGWGDRDEGKKGMIKDKVRAKGKRTKSENL